MFSRVHMVLWCLKLVGHWYDEGLTCFEKTIDVSDIYFSVVDPQRRTNAKVCWKSWSMAVSVILLAFSLKTGFWRTLRWDISLQLSMRWLPRIFLTVSMAASWFAFKFGSCCSSLGPGSSATTSPRIALHRRFQTQLEHFLQRDSHLLAQL